MERNFNMRKRLPCSPIRSCTKSTGPRDSSLMSSAMISPGTAHRTSSSDPASRSTSRFSASASAPGWVREGQEHASLEFLYMRARAMT